MRECATQLYVRAPSCSHGSGRLVGANFCDDRLCPQCARRRSAKLGAKVHERVDILRRDSGVRRYALLTLTVVDREGFDGEEISRLYRLVRELRRTNYWRDRVKGSIGSVEVKRGRGSGWWHPHIHMVVARPECRCRRLPTWGQLLCAHGKATCTHALDQCCLTDMWADICGDGSRIVDIRAVKAAKGGLAGAVAEVTKYATKLTELASADVVTVHRGIAGRRMFFSTGCFRGIRVPTAAELGDDPGPECCGECGLPWVEYCAWWDGGWYRFSRPPPHAASVGGALAE